MRENEDFPIPRDLMVLRNRKRKQDAILTEIALHHLIRQEHKQHCHKIRRYDALFARNMNTPERVTDKEIEAYQKLITDAETEELKQYDVILATCSASVSARVVRGTNIAQIIMDESGMCMEPESLIPLVSFKDAKQIVLIGDHKQLQPIVMDRDAKILGLDQSLFERYSYLIEENSDSAVMLDEQYRMVHFQYILYIL